jgi:hypothetical protein
MQESETGGLTGARPCHACFAVTLLPRSVVAERALDAVARDRAERVHGRHLEHGRLREQLEADQAWRQRRTAKL